MKKAGSGGDDKIDDEDGDESDSDSDDLSDEDDYDDYDRTLLENYASCIDANDAVDEFVIFKDTLQC